MPRLPRREVIDADEIETFHICKRCVRRSFLCGVDPASGKKFNGGWPSNLSLYGGQGRPRKLEALAKLLSP